jgi:GAF domain-containing protein
MAVSVEAQYPANEAGRLEAIRRYDILDTPPDGAFERVTKLASRMLQTPIAIVSIVDEDRIWFKSKVGLDVDQIDRAPGLCASAILYDTPWVVEDARHDPRTLANPLVAGSFGLQFYAGAPLRTHDGHNLGTLCVIDREPRSFSAADQEVLSDLAAIVIDELELRLAARLTLQLNDDVVQSLAVAQVAAASGNLDLVAKHIDLALTSAKRIMAGLSTEASSLRREP